MNGTNDSTTATAPNNAAATTTTTPTATTTSGAKSGQPQPPSSLLQVESFGKFSVNQVRHFNIKLANHLKPTDLVVTISSQILGIIDAKLEWPEANKCQVSFRAPIVGLYTINAEIINQAHEYVTQFQAKAYDLSKVFITGSTGKGFVNQIYEFSVDASEAGEGQLEIAVNEGEIPNQVQVLDNGKCIVNFTPEDAVQHVVDIKFNGHNVNGCPFVVDIANSNGETSAPSQASHQQQVPPILGDPKLVKKERVLVNTPTYFTIDNIILDAMLSASSSNNPELIISDPENQAVNYRISEENYCHRFDFTPTSVGDYNVEIMQNSQLANKLPKDILGQFPFQLKVYDHNKVLVSDVTDGVVGHPIYFFIDASRAGSGNLEIRVSSKTRNVPNYPQSEANAKIRVYFTPTEAVEHSIDIKFNGSSVPGNPFLVKVAQYPQARLPVTSQDLLKYLAINETVSFNIDYIGSVENNNVPAEDLTDQSCQIYVLRPDFAYTKLSTVQLKSSDKNDKQMRFQVDFEPTRIGPYKLFITVNNELLPASPIICNAYNINEVKVFFDSATGDADTQKPSGQINRPMTFVVDASRAGEGTLALAVVSGLSRSPVPTEVKVSDKGHGIYNLTFVPTELAPHSIDMSFNDRLVPNSPFIVDMVDENGKPMQAEQEAMNREIVSKTELQRQAGANVSGHQSQQHQQMVQNFEALSLKQQNGSTLRKSTPKSALKQTYNNNSIASNKKSVAYGLVNASNIVYLNSGVLESNKNQVNLVGPNLEKVPFQLGKASPQAGDSKKAYIEYKPKSIGTHTIQVLEGGKELLQYFVEICDPSLIKITDFKPDDRYYVGKPVTFRLDSSESGEIQLDQITILGPKKAAGKIRDGDQTILSRIKSISSSSSSSHNQTVPIEYSISQISERIQEVKFTPLIAGKYSIDIRCLGQAVGPVPFEINVKIAPQTNQTPDPQQLHTDTQTLGKNGKSTMGASMREDELLQSIVVHGISLKHSPVNSTGAFIIETNRMAQARDFDVLITDPSNNLVDVQCYLQKDGNLLAEWTPRRVGAHKIEVLYKDRQVPGSPFVTESFDPSGVLIENIKTTTVSVGEKVEFRLNRKEAGYGELDVAITSPVGQDLPIEVQPLDEGELGEIISFIPTVAGKYRMSITFGGYEVPKSPVTFIARDGREPVKVGGAGLKCAEVNRSAQFTVDSSTGGELKLRIECVDREIVPKIERNNNSYAIKYKPTEVGYSTISLYWNGAHVEGSPFTVPINDLSKILFLSGTNKSSNSNNQRIIDYEPGVPKEITLDTSKCGPGDLKVEAYCRANPSIKFSIPVEQYVLNRYRITFCCPPEQDQLAKGLNLGDIPLEATYLIRFYYNNLFVPETLASIVVSPLQTYQSRNRSLSRTRRAETERPDAILESNNNNQATYVGSLRPKKAGEGSIVANGGSEPIVALRGHGLVEAKCGEEAEFTIDGSEAGPGRPEIRFTGPSSDEIKIKLQEIGDKRYKAAYLASLPGVYSLNVLWDGKQIAGCPVSVNIVGSCDPTKVICTGDGLKGGVLGEEIKVFIDTRRAGPGELTALCVGPQKVAFCELLDRGDGSFILYIKPQEPGKQFLTIKYGGQHIPKSPFLIKVSGKPDPSKVRVYGPGVEHGVLSLYQSRFVCDTRGAGAGQLTVRIRGPKGAFRMETQRESQRDRTILCKYDPTEPGDYRIEIKWSGRHVPGSPFSVMIFDTQEELNRFLISGQPAPNPAHHITGTKLTGPNQMLHHQVPYQPTLVEYGHYSTMASPNHQQSPFRLQ